MPNLLGVEVAGLLDATEAGLAVVVVGTERFELAWRKPAEAESLPGPGLREPSLSLDGTRTGGGWDDLKDDLSFDGLLILFNDSLDAVLRLSSLSVDTLLDIELRRVDSVSRM